MNRTGKEPIKSPATANPWRNIFSRLGSRQAWVSVILLFLVLEIPTLSIERARWIHPQPSLTLMLVFSMIAAWLLIRGRLPGIVIHIIALAVGAGITAWQIYPLTASETIGFAIFISFLIWVTGYFSTWFILRRHNPWVGACLGTVVILANLSNLPETHYVYLGLFFVAAIFLIVWTHFVKQRQISEQRTGFPKRSLFYMTTVLLCIVVVAVSFAWIVPDARIPQIQTFIATKMLWTQDLEDSFLNLFYKVPSKQPLSTSNTRQDLEFGSVWKQKDDIDYVVVSPQPSYWRVKVYDTYSSEGWSNRPVSEDLLEKDVPWEATDAAATGETITYKVTTNIKTDALLTAGNYISSDINALVGISDGDVISVTTPRVLSPGEHYSVTSRVSSPSPEELSLVGSDYPSSIATQYVRLPANFPDEIRELSKEITGDAETPYQKVLAIDNYLSRFPYQEEIEAPPAGVDAVAYFLYDQKSGFCLYFASAMVVMLRSVDVPARLAVGYISGEKGDEEGEYILRSNYYHAWPQVYFTGYGWVDIEATPSSGGSPVTVGSPFIATVTNPDNSVPNTGLYWQTPPYWYELYGFPTESPTAAVESATIPGRSPFIAELRHAFFILLIIGAILIFIILARLELRSLFYRWLWKVDREHLASRVYSRMCQLTSMAGLEPRPQQTPQEFANELALASPDQVAALDDIVRFYSENQFSPRKGRLGFFDEVTVLKARSSVYRNLIQRLGLLKKLIL
jgi:transglutaminase-like putative cysteine protease